MIDNRTAPLGAFILRATLGVMYLAHSFVLKYLEYSLPGTVEFFRSIGYPGWTAYATFTAELIGGALLLVGVWSRAVPVLLIPVLVGALTVHAGNGWVFSNPNGGWEYPVFLIVVSAVVALLGDGAYALKPTPTLARRPRYA